MSTATLPEAARLGWMPAEELQALGFTPGGPEIDYGMRWGETRAVRVSFAPYAERDGGYLYAQDRGTGRCLLLASDTTADKVDAAWRELTAATAEPDGYLALAALNEQPLSLQRARELLDDCVAREMTAYRSFVDTDTGGRARFDAAHAVVVQRAARVSAEDLLIDAARAAGDELGPVVVRYRILDESCWTGRVAGTSLEAAAEQTRGIQQAADEHQLRLQATSVTQGNTTISAVRVPELAFAATRPQVVSAAPRLAL